jgi:hypothetical protein
VPVEIIAKLAVPLEAPFEKLCRLAVGMEPDAAEQFDMSDAGRRELFNLVDDLDDQQVDKAIRFLRDFVL